MAYYYMATWENSMLLALKVLIITTYTADDTLKYCFFYFPEKMRLDISCEFVCQADDMSIFIFQIRLDISCEFVFQSDDMSIFSLIMKKNICISI